MWRPKISSFKLIDLKNLFFYPDSYSMNWSVWDYEEARAGDRFFMCKVGEAPTGIMMSGHFGSDPYAGEDWSGRGHVTHYCDLDVDHVIYPDGSEPILSAAALAEAVPDFDWSRGHSGQLITESQAAAVEKLWSGLTERGL